MDVPVQMEPALGRGIRPAGASEYGREVVEAEAYGEAAEVGLLVAEDELQVEALAETAGAYRVFILLLAYTGLRWGEASAVRVGRVDLDTRRIRIAEAYGEDKGSLYLDSPKNHEVRTVPIPQFLVEELGPYVDSPPSWSRNRRWKRRPDRAGMY